MFAASRTDRSFRALLSEIIGLIAPSLCLGCGCETLWASDALCPDCHEALGRLSGELCGKCAQPLPCEPCPALDAPWQAAVAACGHGGTATELVTELKQSGARRVAAAMAAEISAAAPLGFWDSCALVPVAPHPSRLRASGVDHAFELAQALGELTGRPVIRALKRGGPAARQAGASLKDRTAEGRLKFSCQLPPAARIALIDDVYTSGSTLASAARCLAANGAESIRVASFSRAVLNIASVPGRSDW